MLASQEILTDVIGSLYEAACDATLWKEFLGELARISEANSAALVMHESARAFHTLTATWGIEPQASRLYEQHYGSTDIWAERAHSIPAGCVLTSDSLCPLRELARTEFYNDFLAQNDVAHGLFAIVAKDEARIASVSLYRSACVGEFDISDLKTFKILTPHIQRAFKLHFEFSELKARSESIETALNMLATGVVFVGGTGQVVLMNSRADELLRERDGLLMAGREVTASLRQESRLLRAIVDSAVSTANGRRLGAGGTLLVSRQKGRPLSITVAPLRTTTLSLPKSPAAVLFISDPDQSVEVPADMLRRCHGLTVAEARLAVVLLEGRSLKEAADLCGVTYNTAKSRLKSVFSKTQVRRQSELVRLLLPSSGVVYP